LELVIFKIKKKQKNFLTLVKTFGSIKFKESMDFNETTGKEVMVKIMVFD
jgi:hypothetical protein